jgi:hypothetical protein
MNHLMISGFTSFTDLLVGEVSNPEKDFKQLFPRTRLVPISSMLKLSCDALDRLGTKVERIRSTISARFARLMLAYRPSLSFSADPLHYIRRNRNQEEA